MTLPVPMQTIFALGQQWSPAEVWAIGKFQLMAADHASSSHSPSHPELTSIKEALNTLFCQITQLGEQIMATSAENKAAIQAAFAAQGVAISNIAADIAALAKKIEDGQTTDGLNSADTAEVLAMATSIQTQLEQIAAITPDTPAEPPVEPQV